MSGYNQDDNHVIIKALKRKGWVIFEITYATLTADNGICGGWWIDCYATYETEHYKSHRAIHGKWLGQTIKVALCNIKDLNFPINL